MDQYEKGVGKNRTTPACIESDNIGRKKLVSVVELGNNCPTLGEVGVEMGKRVKGA